MENIKEKEVVLWEGFKKELPWILLWLLIGIMAYGYYQDKKICEDILTDPCDACYKYELDQSSLLDSDSLSDYKDIYINNSLLENEDKNPNAKTISNYRE